MKLAVVPSGFSAAAKGAGSQVAARRPGRVSWLGEVVGEVAQARDAGVWSQNPAPACAEVASALPLRRPRPE